MSNTIDACIAAAERRGAEKARELITEYAKNCLYTDFIATTKELFTGEEAYQIAINAVAAEKSQDSFLGGATMHLHKCANCGEKDSAYLKVLCGGCRMDDMESAINRAERRGTEAERERFRVLVSEMLAKEVALRLWKAYRSKQREPDTPFLGGATMHLHKCKDKNCAGKCVQTRRLLSVKKGARR